MNFTRDPIIETVIIPREGYKLLVRNSKGKGTEEYCLDSVEIISFGQSLFFRSQERPKSFIVPVSDYEVFEQKEVRMSLKNVAPESSIKIGGGRDFGMGGQSRDVPLQQQGGLPPGAHAEHSVVERDRKRDKRRRGRRGGGRSEVSAQEPRDPLLAEDLRPVHGALTNEETMAGSSSQEKSLHVDLHPEERKETSFISKLFPPPTTLIKETLNRYKAIENGFSEVPVSEKEEKESDPFFNHPQTRDKDSDSEYGSADFEK